MHFNLKLGGQSSKYLIGKVLLNTPWSFIYTHIIPDLTYKY